MSRHPQPSRRSFVSLLSLIPGLSGLAGVSGLAGAAALTLSATEVAEAQAAGGSGAHFDLKWMDELKKGQHKQVFDMADAPPASQPPPLRLPRNYMDTFRDVMKLEPPAIQTVVGISGTAFPVNASDRLWEKYALGERSKIIDPATKQPAVRNIFLDEPTLGIKALQARGTIFWQCDIALTSIAQQLATARGLSAADVKADLVAGLNPGVRIVPSHVMALGLVQERGATYVKI